MRMEHLGTLGTMGGTLIFICVSAKATATTCSKEGKREATALTCVIISFLQDVLDSKNSAIKDLQYELARVCKVSNTFSLSLFFLC